MADEQLKPGDMVRLKSGGEEMTVLVYEKDIDSVVCDWFEGKKHKREGFRPEMLIKIDKDAGQADPIYIG